MNPDRSSKLAAPALSYVTGQCPSHILNARRVAAKRLPIPDLVEHLNPDGDDPDFSGPCPFAEGHSTPSFPDEFRIWIRGEEPRMFCRHESCTGKVSQLWARLNLSAHSRKNGPPKVAVLPMCNTLAQKLRAQPKSQALLDAERGRIERAAIIESPRTVAELLAASPVPACEFEDPVDQTALFLGAFDVTRSHKLLWTGMPNTSGKSYYFRPVRTVVVDRAAVSEEPLFVYMIDTPYGSRFIPAAFCSMGLYREGTERRKNEEIAREFFVFECDASTKEAQVALIFWLRDTLRLPLVAVIDSGGKSLHAWFRLGKRLTPSDLHEMSAFLCGCNWREVPKAMRPTSLKTSSYGGLGGDPKMLNPSQPARLAGVPRIDLVPPLTNKTTYEEATNRFMRFCKGDFVDVGGWDVDCPEDDDLSPFREGYSRVWLKRTIQRLLYLDLSI